MRKSVLSAALVAALMSSNAHADALGLFIGAGSWDHDSSGDFGTVGDTVIDVESDLGYDDESDTYVWAAFEHFVPLVPNIRIEAASMEHAGSASSVTFNGQSLTGDSEISLDTTDAILYYRLLDNWVNFDLGINIRNLEADFTVDSETVSVDETVPMIYAAVAFDMPLTGLSIGGDISVIDYDDNTYQDLRIRATYEMGVVGFEAGIKTTSIELAKLKDMAEHAEYHTGEITVPGVLICDHCGEQLHFKEAGHIPPCAKCNETRFHRLLCE